MKSLQVFLLSISWLASISAHAGFSDNAVYLKQLGNFLCTSSTTGDVDPDCIKAANAYLAKWKIPSKDIPDLLSYEAGFEANICLGPQNGDSDCFDAVQDYSRFEQMQSIWKTCTMSEKKDPTGYAKCYGDTLMSIHNKYQEPGNSCEEKLAASQKIISDLDSRVSKTDVLKGQLDSIVQTIMPQSNSSVSKNSGDLAKNKRYLTKVGNAICSTWSGYQSKSDCSTELNFYFVRYPVPSASGTDLLNYESGFESYMCLQDEYAVLGVVDTWSSGAAKCFQAVAEQTQFPEVKAAVQGCSNRPIKAQANCAGDQLSSIHERSSLPPCETQLSTLQQQVAALNARSSSGSLKEALDTLSLELSQTPAAASAK